MDGTYFIKAQNCLEKLNILKMKLLLQLNFDIYNLEINIGHQYEKCNYGMSESASDVFSSLEELEEKISKATKMSLVHMAGYVTQKDPTESENDLLEETTYFQEYGSFTHDLDRGSLNIPADRVCQ